MVLENRLAFKGQDDHALTARTLARERRPVSLSTPSGAHRNSGPKESEVGSFGTMRPLSCNPALECLADLGGILLGDRASCQDDCQNAEKKSHRSHTTYNKKADP